jgi:hypothetical protein
MFYSKLPALGLFCSLILMAEACKKEDSPIATNPTALPNASFEGVPGIGGEVFGLDGWSDCGFPGHTVPDIHPSENGGIFQVTTLPFDGDTYLGLVVRDDETYEAISSKLEPPLVGKQDYSFSVAVCRSSVYGVMGSNNISYTKPIRLRIWGGNDTCADEELLAQSPTITDTVWQVLRFEIKPKKDYQFIKLEAFYQEGSPFPYNGNILLDKLSAFMPL